MLPRRPRRSSNRRRLSRSKSNLFVALAAVLSAVVVFFFLRRQPESAEQQGVWLKHALSASAAYAQATQDAEKAEKKGALDDALAKLPEWQRPLVRAQNIAGLKQGLAPLLLVRETVLRPHPDGYVDVLDEPMHDDHSDDWLLDEGYVSRRMIERQLIALLLAAVKQPEKCPVDIRLKDRLALGARIDAVYAASAGNVDTEALLPLCKRERQWRLANEAMQKRGGFPFVSGLIYSELERAVMKKLENTPGVSGQARLFIASMQDYDAAFDARAVDTSALFASLVHDARSDLAHSADKRRFLAQRFARFAGETFPPPGERERMIAFLYAQAGLPIPAEGAVSAENLMLLWDRALDAL